MKNLSALFLTAAFGLSIAGPLFAQGPDGPPPGGDPQAQGGGFQGQGGGFGGQRQGGRGGYGRQRRPPFAFGTVSAVDATAGTVTVTTGGGQSQTINVNPDAKIVSQQTASVSDLKVGDQIVVQGVPTGITASSVTVGQAPTGLPGAGGGFGGRRFGSGGGAGTGSASAESAQAFATATGTIKALPTKAEPHLALTMSSDAVLFLKIADTAKVVKYVSLTLAGIKTGDTIIASGQTGTDGTLAASTLGVNMPLPNGGQFGGGGGQFGGGGGQYGRGGFRRAPADDQGGQGNGGGPGGDPGAPPPPQDGGAPPPPAPDAAEQQPMDNGQ